MFHARHKLKLVHTGMIYWAKGLLLPENFGESTQPGNDESSSIGVYIHSFLSFQPLQIYETFEQLLTWQPSIVKVER